MKHRNRRGNAEELPRPNNASVIPLLRLFGQREQRVGRKSALPRCHRQGSSGAKGPKMALKREEGGRKRWRGWAWEGGGSNGVG